MIIKKKYMNKENWKRLIDKKYVTMDIIENNKIIGVASLIHILNLTSPCYKNYEDIPIKIADKNYYWLQIGLKSENYWITVMYDNNKEIIQYYIDITLKNFINENPGFYDIFLDIVKLNNGKIFILDEDEIMAALNEKLITKVEYDNAYKCVKMLKILLDKKDNKIELLCNKYFKLLQNKLN